jgi:hypothetical protein
VTVPFDPSQVTAVCPSCHDRLAAELAIESAPHQYELRWLLIRLLGIVAVSLCFGAVDRLAAFFVWACSSIATIALSRWHTARLERLHPIAELPSATVVSPAEPGRRPPLPLP